MPVSAKLAFVSSVFFWIILGHGAAQLPISYRVTLYDVPGARATEVRGINNRGDIVGGYVSPDIVFHGYMRSARMLTLTALLAPDGTSHVSVKDNIPPPTDPPT